MRKSSAVVLCFLFSFTNSFAQSDLFTPLDFLKAVENETRTLTGIPGENYWQNSADYFIKATSSSY